MSEKVRLSSAARDKSPCEGCTERFTACHDRCPKDERGQYGFKEYRNRIEQVKDARRQYEMKYNPYFHNYKEEHHESK